MLSTVSRIQPVGYVMIALVLFSLWAAIRVLKRIGKGQRLGCVSVGYVWLIIFSIGSLAFGGTLLLYESLRNFTQGERIEATITDFTVREQTSSDDDGPMFVPIIRFTAPNGEVITREGNTGSGAEPIIGEIYVIYYDSERDSLSNFSFGSIALLTAGGVMTFFLSLILFGIVRYALGGNMAAFWSYFQNFLTLFFLPLAMIAFNALLICAMVFAGPHPRWVYALLGIFIFAMTLTIWGYLRMVGRKGAPKWKRTGNTLWVADWDDDTKA